MWVLALWLLLVAAIGTVVVIGVVRPARKSGRASAPILTRRTRKQSAVSEGPVRSAAERNRESRRSRRRRPGPSPLPTTPPVRLGEPSVAPSPTAAESAGEVNAPHPTVSEPAAFAHNRPAAQAPAAAEARSPQTRSADDVSDAEAPIVIDARTRWAAQAESEHDQKGRSGLDDSAEGGLRKAE